MINILFIFFIYSLIGLTFLKIIETLAEKKVREVEIFPIILLWPIIIATIVATIFISFVIELWDML